MKRIVVAIVLTLSALTMGAGKPASANVAGQAWYYTCSNTGQYRVHMADAGSPSYPVNVRARWANGVNFIQVQYSGPGGNYYYTPGANGAPSVLDSWKVGTYSTNYTYSYYYYAGSLTC